MPLPALRPLDIFPVKYQGRTRFALKDPAGVAEKVLLLGGEALFIASCLDGKNEAEDIQRAFASQFDGASVSLEDIARLVATLDEGSLLDSPAFRERMRKVREEYSALPVRPAAFAGKAYPEDAGELARLLDSYFEPPGPGRGHAPAGKAPAGLVSPHIDFTRGGPSYAWAYRELLGREPVDLYVILGVAHAGPSSPFVLSLKDYDTPFGPAETDRELARALCRESGQDLASLELAHRGEHSVEFQAVWLKYVGSRLGRPFKILPLLCSSVGPAPARAADPAHETLDALRRLLKDYPGKVCLLAGVDLAHVGPRFGDDKPVAELLPWMVEEDRKSLEFLLRMDAAGFHGSVMEDGGRRKVCGLGALYAFAWLLCRLAPGSEGRLLRYDHAPDPSGGEVSFASLAFGR